MVKAIGRAGAMDMGLPIHGRAAVIPFLRSENAEHRRSRKGCNAPGPR